jgi:hypothetical protein
MRRSRFVRVLLGLALLAGLTGSAVAVSLVAVPAQPASAAGCVNGYAWTNGYHYLEAVSGRTIWEESRDHYADWGSACTNIWVAQYRNPSGQVICGNVRVAWDTGYKEPWKWLCAGDMPIAALRRGHLFRFQTTGPTWMAPGSFYYAH